MLKKCTKCGIEKEVNKDNFHWRNDNNCFRAACILCVRGKDKDRNKLRRPVKLKNNCYKCGNDISYLNSSFRTSCDSCILKYRRAKDKKRRPGTLQTNCKKCNCDISCLNSFRKLYCNQCRDMSVKNNSNKWNLNNKDLANLRKREYIKRKLKHDDFFKLRCVVSSAVRKALKLNGGSKKGISCLKHLGYTITELKKHLELQFEPWMTWNNWGIYDSKTWDDNNTLTWKWNIDHIIPQSKLPYDSMDHPNFKKCWTLENLRPLSAKQNIMDGVLKIRHNIKK